MEPQRAKGRKAEPSPRLEAPPGPPIAPGASVTWNLRVGKEGVEPVKVPALFSQISFSGFGKGLSFKILSSSIQVVRFFSSF